MMIEYLDQLRNIQDRLSGFHDGLQAKAIELDSPFIHLLVDELSTAARGIDFAVSQLSPPPRPEPEPVERVSKCGSIQVSDYDQIMTDGL